MEPLVWADNMTVDNAQDLRAALCRCRHATTSSFATSSLFYLVPKMLNKGSPLLLPLYLSG